MDSPSWTEVEVEPEFGTDPHSVLKGTERINRYAEILASKTPTLLFLFAAVIAIVVSALQFRRNRHLGLFIGQWAPSLLLLGLYNKLSKTMGAD